jgi:hypothetical protein
LSFANFVALVAAAPVTTPKAAPFAESLKVFKKSMSPDVISWFKAEAIPEYEPS